MNVASGRWAGKRTRRAGWPPSKLHNIGKRPHVRSMHRTRSEQEGTWAEAGLMVSKSSAAWPKPGTCPHAGREHRRATTDSAAEIGGKRTAQLAGDSSAGRSADRSTRRRWMEKQEPRFRRQGSRRQDQEHGPAQRARKDLKRETSQGHPASRAAERIAGRHGLKPFARRQGERCRATARLELNAPTRHFHGWTA